MSSVQYTFQDIGLEKELPQYMIIPYIWKFTEENYWKFSWEQPHIVFTLIISNN